MQSAHTDAAIETEAGWFDRFLAIVQSVLRWVKVRRQIRALRICETLSLGDKRFLAVVEFEGRRFLIGATNQSISLLDQLESAAPQRRRLEPSPERSFPNGVH